MTRDKFKQEKVEYEKERMLRKSMMYSAVAALLMASSENGVAAKQLYDHVSSDVSVYGKLNFEKQVSKNREKGISIVHFYKDEGK